MDGIEFVNLFQGVATLLDSDPVIMIGRISLIALGVLLVYLGRKGVLEALLMVPMGIGMATINAAVMVLDMETGAQGTLFLDPLVPEGATDELMRVLQVDWMQPIYTFTFSNGLIACLIFVGIGVLLDVGFLMARPFTSMTIALFAELGTFIVFPLAIAFGMDLPDAAATATIGGADGPMVLFAALILSEDLFVPITVVAYLYLGLIYGGYPYLIRLMVPARLRALPMPPDRRKQITSNQKLIFAVTANIILCLLFPVAAPLFMSLFLGVIIRESGLVHFAETFSGPILYGATFFLGLLLGVLCEARVILSPEVLILLVLGIIALLFSGIGGILGGYVLYYASGRKYNPVIGIAGVSCVPTSAKVAQKTVSEANPDAIIMPHALGASVSGVITSAIIAGILITIVSAQMGGVAQ